MANTSQHYNTRNKKVIKGFSIKTPLLFNYYFTLVKIGFIILTPIILIILPSDFFDKGQSICLSRLIFNIECYACGMTRAVMHLIHLEFKTASSYNNLSFIVLPVLCIVWVQWYLKELKLYKRFRNQLATNNASGQIQNEQ